MVINTFIKKTNLCRYTLELPQRDYSNVCLQHMLLKIRKKTICKFTFSKSCPLS